MVLVVWYYLSFPAVGLSCKYDLTILFHGYAQIRDQVGVTTSNIFI